MLITSSPKNLDLIQLFHQGGVFAYPTEAVFGLGCDPDNQTAVLRLLDIKKRPIEKGLILVAANFSQVEKYLQPLNDSLQELTVPSEITYTFPALDSAPQWLTGNFNSLAIRISKHPLVKELCYSLDSALVSTSANLSGQPPAKTFQHMVDAQLPIDAILEGETGESLKPSVIRDGLSGKVLRL